MKVTTRSEQPQMRSEKVPHTSVTITVSRARNSSEQEQRDQELQFLALLVRVMNPQVRIKRVNEALRAIVEPDLQNELWPGAGKPARDESTGAARSK